MRVVVRSSHKIRLEALELLVRRLGFEVFSSFEQFAGPVVVLVDLTDLPAPFPEANQMPTIALVPTNYCAKTLKQLGYLGWVEAEATSTSLKAALKKLESSLGSALGPSRLTV